MSQSESGVGAVIIAVIVIGAGWVCFGMMHESEPTGPTMPDVSMLGKQSKTFLSTRARDNPYVEALLLPRTESGQVGESERFSRLMKQYLRAGGPGRSADLSTIQKVVDTGDNAHVGQALNDISALCAGEQTGPALTQVKETIKYADTHGGVAPQKRIDLALIGSRLSYRDRDFDQSRQFVDQGITLAHQSHDYKMDDLEGLRCILNGNASEATKYNLILSDYNYTMAKSNYSRLPKLADDLLGATVTLPEDSYFQLQAELSKANAMIQVADNKDQTRSYLKKVEAQAQRAQDLEIAENCAGLLAKIANN